MKLNKIMIYGMIFIAILTLGAVNATDNVTVDDLSVINDADNPQSSLDVESDIVDELSVANLADENSISSSDEMNNLALIPVTIDAKVVDNSRVDNTAGNVTGNVIVIVDNNENTIPLDNGTASFLLNNLSAGNHSLVVIYEGDATYDATHCASVFNIPEKNTLLASEFSDITIADDLTVSMVLKDKKGNVIAEVPIKYTISGRLTNTQTDKNGLITIKGSAGQVIAVAFEGNANFAPTNTTLTLNNPVAPTVVKIATQFNISGGVITVTGYAVDIAAGEEGIYFTTQLLDDSGNPIKGVPIQFAVNNKIYDRVTFDDGSFEPYKLNMVRAGRYTMAFFFYGNSQYVSTFASVCVDLDKKPVSIKASAKTYKVSAKTKKYSVTFSTIVGSSHDGKVHFSPKKVTLTIGGKTYSAKTGSNGKATFNLKITKKGKYTAKIKFAGDSTYQSKSKSVKITIK